MALPSHLLGMCSDYSHRLEGYYSAFGLQIGNPVCALISVIYWILVKSNELIP